MYKIFGLSLFVFNLFAQSNSIQLCDQQTTRHCFGIKAPVSLSINPSPVTFSANNGALLVGMATTDLSVLPGAIVSIDSFVSATAITAASIGSFAAVSGNYVAVSSAISPGGTYLPMAFFTHAAERMRILTTGFVGIGTTAPNGEFEVVSTGSTDPRGVISTEYSNSNFAAAVQLRKSGGTLASPSAITTGHTIGSILFSAWNGSVWQYPAYITSQSILTGSDLGASLNFATRAPAGALIERMIIGSNGFVGIGTVSPNAELEVITTSSTDPRGVTISAYNSSNFASTLVMRSAAGTLASPTIKTNLDTLGSILFSAWNGSSWQYPAYIAARSLISGTNIGSDLRFATRTPGGALIERVIFGDTGVSLFGLASTTVSASAGAIISSDAFISSTATSNSSVGSFAAVAGNYVAIASSASSGGTFLPMTFFTNATERARILVNGVSLFGMSSTDMTLAAGAIVSADTIVSATATSNASVLSIAAVAGTYTSISSSKSGAGGTVLPMVFFMGTFEFARFLTTGPTFLIGRTTDDGTGANFQTGTVSAGTRYYIGGTGGLIGSTATVRNSAGTGTCTLTITGGLITATTC